MYFMPPLAPPSASLVGINCFPVILLVFSLAKFPADSATLSSEKKINIFI